MGNLYKVVVTGPFNVGKTEFVRTVSDIPIVSTEKRITDHLASTKEETTVAMDYGHTRLGDDMFHLYGTPGQPRFDFMWDILSTEMQAYLLLVDSSDRQSLSVSLAARVAYLVWWLQTSRIWIALSRLKRSANGWG
jgi:signal recognition particle receptor subunit beta